MATNVSICSNALLELGAQTINSFDENNDRARLASNLYDQVRDATLRAHSWNCAIKRVVLAPETATPAFSWNYQFAIPDDWLRTLQVGEDGVPIDYRMEGRRILANTNVLYLKYVYRNDVESTWDTMLVDAMTKHMKARMCYPITKSTSAAELAMRDFESFLRQCRAVDGQDDPPETLGDYPMLASRYSGIRWTS